MRETILGKKLGMTQIFDRSGNAVPVTLVQAGPCTVLQVKTSDTDGYNAIQLGFDSKKEKNTTRPLMGHFARSGSGPVRHIRESRVDDPSRYQVGMVLTAGLFRSNDVVDVTGTSKGKGFAGVMKRHGFSGFEQSHGVHESFRGPGSIGAAADPSRVFKGRSMPGRMGNETVTVQNLTVVDVREDQNILVIKGPVPGGRNGLLIIRHAIKKDAPEDRELMVPGAEPAEGEPEPKMESAPASGSDAPQGDAEGPVEESAQVAGEDAEADAPRSETEGAPEPTADQADAGPDAPGEGDDGEAGKA